MANYTQEQWNAKKVELMEKCFDDFAELGLHGTGIRTPAKPIGRQKARQEIPPDVSGLYPPEIQRIRSEVL